MDRAWSTTQVDQSSYLFNVIFTVNWFLFFHFSKGPKAAVVALRASATVNNWSAGKETFTVLIWMNFTSSCIKRLRPETSLAKKKNNAVAYTIRGPPDITITVQSTSTVRQNVRYAWGISKVQSRTALNKPTTCTKISTHWDKWRRIPLRQ